MNPILPAVAFAAISVSGCQQADDAAFGQRVRAYLLEHPEVLQEAMTKLQEKEQQKAASASRTALAKYRDQLERDPRDLVVNPKGAVTVVEFFDYNCGYCKVAAPEVVKLIAEHPEVRFVFKEFAFQTPSSIAAARIAVTPTAKPKGLALYQSLMAQRPLDDAAIDRSLQAAGVDVAQARREAADPAVERQITDVHQLAQALGIDGTPAFVVGDRIIPGADMAALRAAIAEARAGAGRQAP